MLFAVAVLFLTGSAKKEARISIRCHTEVRGAKHERFHEPVTLKYGRKRTYIEKVPIISHYDIEAFYPFEAPDGSMGAYFMLGKSGRTRLDTLSIEKRGTSLVIFVNGRQVVDLVIDRRISDGILSIPRGLRREEVAQMREEFKVIGGNDENDGAGIRPPPPPEHR